MSSGSLVADMNASASDLWHISAFDAFTSFSCDVALLSLELQRADPTRFLRVVCGLSRLLADQFLLLAFGTRAAAFSSGPILDTPS